MNNNLLNVNDNNRHAVTTRVLKAMVTACIPLELAIEMEAEVNISHQLSALLSGFSNKQMNTNKCNKINTSLNDN